MFNKDEGRVKFKNLMDFNSAMFGKQFWRLIEKSNTLSSEMFKGRYFRHGRLKLYKNPVQKKKDSLQ